MSGFAAMFIVLATTAVLAGGAAQAGEPSVADAHPPGVTIGVPAGSAPPAGVFLRLTPSYYSADMVDGAGNANGTHVESTSLTPSLIWSTGWEILGARHFAIVNQPIVSTHIKGPHMAGNPAGLFNFYVSPINLSWTLAPGIFVSAGAGAYVPSGNGGEGNDFWTYEQQLGLSYLRDGWNLSLAAFYDVNGENRLTHYTTGDHIYVDVTATKTFDGLEIGPVGYIVDQTTNDNNAGMAYGPFKPTFGNVQRVGLGGLIGYRFGPLAVQGYFTSEVYARNGGSGTRGWLTVTFPLWMDAPVGISPVASN